MAANTKVAAVLGVDTSQAPAEPGKAMSTDVGGKKTTTRNISVGSYTHPKTVRPSKTCAERLPLLLSNSALPPW